MYDLQGKVALVTGAGGEKGIGRGISLRLAEEGADVVVSDLSLNESEDWGGLPALVKEIEGLGRRSLAVETDVTQADQVERMVADALSQLGRIDILVNNAGALAGSDRVPVVELKESDWDRVLGVNAKGTFLCSRAVARHMIEQGGGGKMINIASIAGKKGTARFAAYCSSKWAVLGFTQCIALELAPHKVNVNAICPGLVETERVLGMASGLKPDGVTAEEFRDRMVERTNQSNPLGRIAQAADVARMAAFLASSESDYITGLGLSVCGGSVMS